MAPSNFTSLVGSFKIKYQEGKLKDFRLNVCPILDSVPFRKAATGTSIEMDIPVALTQHSGNTFQAAGANSVPNAPVPAVVLAAKVTNQEIVGALDVPFGVLQALSNGDVVSYLNPTLLRVFELEKSVRRDQEITHLHGNTGIGQVSALSAVTAFGAIFQRTITISGATWASGIWKFMEGSPYDAYSLAQAGTKRNTAVMTLGAGGVAGVLAQTAVSPSTKQIVLTGATADLSAIAVNDFLFRANANGVEGLGLKFIFSNTTATLFNIPALQYSGWQASQVAVNGQPLTFVKLASGVAEAVSGALASELEVQTSPKSFANLLTDQAGLRRYAAKPSAFENGAEGVTFYSEAGKIAVISNPFVMEGDTFGYPKDTLMRIGTTEPTDTMGGLRLEVVNPSATSVRFYFFAAEQIFAQQLAACIYWSGIVPNV
jgi:hypothetical protein